MIPPGFAGTVLLVVITAGVLGPVLLASLSSSGLRVPTVAWWLGPVAAAVAGALLSWYTLSSGAAEILAVSAEYRPGLAEETLIASQQISALGWMSAGVLSFWTAGLGSIAALCGPTESRPSPVGPVALAIAGVIFAGLGYGSIRDYLGASHETEAIEDLRRYRGDQTTVMIQADPRVEMTVLDKLAGAARDAGYEGAELIAASPDRLGVVLLPPVSGNVAGTLQDWLLQQEESWKNRPEKKPKPPSVH